MFSLGSQLVLLMISCKKFPFKARRSSIITCDCFIFGFHSASLSSEILDCTNLSFDNGEHSLMKHSS